MKHLRIAGKRVRTVELYLYLLSTVVTSMVKGPGASRTGVTPA